MTGARQVTSLVNNLMELEARGFESDAVLVCLATDPLDPDSLAPYLHFSLHHYTRNPFHRTDCFELIAICWEIGQASPIHDHENEHCWARVEQGRLEFTNYRVVDPDPLSLQREGSPTTGLAGYVDALPGIHRVDNPHSFAERGVSLHLYSRPFAQCSVYDPDQGVRHIRRLTYDTVPA